MTTHDQSLNRNTEKKLDLNFLLPQKCKFTPCGVFLNEDTFASTMQKKQKNI